MRTSICLIVLGISFSFEQLFFPETLGKKDVQPKTASCLHYTLSYFKLPGSYTYRKVSSEHGYLFLMKNAIFQTNILNFLPLCFRYFEKNRAIQLNFVFCCL